MVSCVRPAAGTGGVLVQGHITGEAHSESQDGDPENEPLDDHSHGPVEDGHQQRTVEVAQMVGHQHVGSPGIEMIESRRFDADPEDTSADPHHPTPVGEERLAEPEENAHEQDGDTDQKQDDVDEDKEEIAQRRPPI